MGNSMLSKKCLFFIEGHIRTGKYGHVLCDSLFPNLNRQG